MKVVEGGSEKLTNPLAVVTSQFWTLIYVSAYLRLCVVLVSAVDCMCNS